MANLTHIFSVGDKVICRTEGGMRPGTVSETYEDHIIVDVPSISNHMWYEEGWNIGDVFPDYNFQIN